jgi:beta-glucuronidase
VRIGNWHAFLTECNTQSSERPCRIQFRCLWNSDSEFGGGAPFGNHGDTEARWTEEYQANLYVHQLNMVQRMPTLAGLSPWVLMDFRSPRRLLPCVQDYYNRKGVVSDPGDRKKAFYVLQGFYRRMQEAANRPDE